MTFKKIEFPTIDKKMFFGALYIIEKARIVYDLNVNPETCYLSIEVKILLLAK